MHCCARDDLTDSWRLSLGCSAAEQSIEPDCSCRCSLGLTTLTPPDPRTLVARSSRCIAHPSIPTRQPNIPAYTVLSRRTPTRSARSIILHSFRHPRARWATPAVRRRTRNRGPLHPFIPTRSDRSLATYDRQCDDSASVDALVVRMLFPSCLSHTPPFPSGRRPIASREICGLDFTSCIFVDSVHI